MKVLVTGAAGFVGGHFARKLLAENIEFIAVDCLLNESYSSLIKLRNFESLAIPKTSKFQIDLRSENLEFLGNDFTHIVNFAAMPGMIKSWSDFKLYSDSNLLTVSRLLEFAKMQSNLERFIQISTSSVYGENAICNEAEDTKPFSPYGVTKLSAEKLAFSYLYNFQVPVTVLRYFSVYGPNQRPDMAFNIFINRMLRDESLTIFGNGEQTRSNTYIDDCIDGTFSALSNARVGQIYNIGGGTTISVNDSIKIISEFLGILPKIQFYPSRPGDQLHTRADFTKAKIDLDFNPKILPEDGLIEQARWQMSNP